MKPINDWKMEDGVWYRRYCTGVNEDGDEIHQWLREDITVIPVMTLIRYWEKLVKELSMKEVELYNLKEAYLIAEQKIINETDFKELYGKNNEKVRSQHVKSELADMVQEKASLQFSIDFIKNYIPLLREVIQVKKE